jgi:hypothetical protein
VGGSRPPYDVDGYSKRDPRIGDTFDERFGVAETASPWYLQRWVLALWGLAVVILIATIIYGLAILARGSGGSAPATTTRPSTTAPSRTTTPSRTSTPSSTTTAPSTVPPASLLPTETAPQPALPTTPQGRHRHHWNGTIPPLPPIHIPGLTP